MTYDAKNARKSRFRNGLILLAVLLVSSRLSAQTLTITHATIVDVSNGTLERDRTVVVEGNRIAGVGPSSRTRTPHGLVIDAAGMYMIPGLWDMHTHAYFDWPGDFGNDLVLPLFIANGVTGIRDMGSDLDAVLHARREVAAHRLLGPRMIVSGPMLDGPKAQYKAAIAIATPDDGRKAVDMLKGRGVDFIKIQSGVPRDAYFAVADESKKAGIAFEGHVPDAIRAEEAVAAGQRTFEHLIGIFEASTPDEEAYLSRKYGAGKDPSINKSLAAFLDRYDPLREAGIIQLLAKHTVWQCPTLFWERGQWLVDAIDYTKDPDLAYAAHSWIEKTFPRSQKSILQTLDTDPLPVRTRFVDHELDIVRKLHAAGVPFLAGTDTPAGVDVIPGISLHLELQRFVAAGFTPLEALQTATLNPAKFYGKTGDYGGIHAGSVADLVLLKGNPLQDVANTRTIAAVIADGRYVSQGDLVQLRDRLRQLAATK
jgi:imidazolonepropionase-like amidohydrolase